MSFVLFRFTFSPFFVQFRDFNGSLYIVPQPGECFLHRILELSAERWSENHGNAMMGHRRYHSQSHNAKMAIVVAGTNTLIYFQLCYT